MADWVIYDAGAAAETLPPSLATAYAAWLDAATRAQRLALLVSGVVADFRKAVAADADATGKLDAASVPLSCLRHVSAVTWYMLANEMGSDAEDFRSAWLDSEIYLRRLFVDNGTPSIQTRLARHEMVIHALLWVVSVAAGTAIAGIVSAGFMLAKLLAKTGDV